MIKYSDQGMVWTDGAPEAAPADIDKSAGRNGTIAYQILNSHRKESDDGIFHIKFDALVSHEENTAAYMFRPIRVSSTHMPEKNWLHAAI